jgi:cytosine/adenosine deaminase-related metal-dependent hydrolase
MGNQTLLKNGVVIVHEADGTARGLKADLLIEDDRIQRIEPELSQGSNITVIDCTDKIIAPGFIDTHRHMYNTVLRGRHGNNVLADYLVQGAK